MDKIGEVVKIEECVNYLVSEDQELTEAYTQWLAADRKMHSLKRKEKPGRLFKQQQVSRYLYRYFRSHTDRYFHPDVQIRQDRGMYPTDGTAEYVDVLKHLSIKVTFYNRRNNETLILQGFVRTLDDLKKFRATCVEKANALAAVS